MFFANMAEHGFQMIAVMDVVALSFKINAYTNIQVAIF
jgi:hypothetical protein